ncbi:cytosine/adenosine deaminase [Candidatus Kinetoplastibacterium desouzaii TCC079E]|uniref:tRNA-specific adenosine deaminase n=1 Tax=Candidatus Kinetoplastidibacterium desouzai TCC079E TaxID=1208919 RepID=M1LRQ2_9PROT|nr:nucleoside deaminase [Candidatus Kinetoplastibacterium desouzaii]AGF46816.1 cytosine/adenosine deaminase [Candidatus Kinetoplastibacterium desouzaii TCC079E]
MSFDTFMLKLALEEAKNAYNIDEVPVGAVVVDRFGDVIGYGYNRTIVDCDPTAHAEIVAIRSASKSSNNHRLFGANIYVTLEPCLMCLGAIFHSRIENVIYGAKDKKFGFSENIFNISDLKKINHHANVSQSKDNIVFECGNILSMFFEGKRNK